MRLLLIAGFAAGAAIVAVQAAPLPAQAQAAQAAAQPLDARLDRLNAQLEEAFDKGWLDGGELERLGLAIIATRNDANQIRGRNEGRLPDADNERLSAQTAVLERDTAEAIENGRRFAERN